MSTKMLKNEPAFAKPVPSALEEPGIEAEVRFLPSSELGEQLERLEEAQVEIDRKKTEELAHLRELQDRD